MKECIITNGRFTYLMEVDGHKITFQGSYSADYFEQHYKDLGYKVVRKQEDEPPLQRNL